MCPTCVCLEVSSPCSHDSKLIETPILHRVIFNKVIMKKGHPQSLTTPSPNPPSCTINTKKFADLPSVSFCLKSENEKLNNLGEMTGILPKKSAELTRPG